jgi:Phosphotransferase enzyme family
MKMHAAFASIESSRGASGSLKGRLDRLEHWYLTGRFTSAFCQLENASGPDTPHSDLAGRILNSFRRLARALQDSLVHSAGIMVDLQPVHGDLRNEHVLFDPELESVSGVVDFGAMKTDSIGLDIGRLAGGWFGSRADKWQEAWRFMQETGPIGPTEWRLANVFYSTGTALAGLNWLQWICVEKRNMGSFDAIKLRMSKIATGMETLELNL